MVKIIETLIPNNTPARPGTRRRKFSGVTIHETGNTKSGAGARNHSQYKTVNGGWNAEESYTYVVDDKEAYRLLPENEIGWHAGDGFGGSGNNETVSIEICVNPDSNFTNAMKNAAEITADVLKRNGITSANGWVHQHNKWSGKNCPQQIREGGRWGEFMNYVQGFLNGTTVTVPPTTTDVVYRVRKSFNEAATQVGAYKDLANAKACADKNKGYYVFDHAGNKVYPASTPSANGKEYVNLFAVRETWAVYPVGVSRTPANVKGHLQPLKYKGLSYTVVTSLGNSGYVINTGAYGQVQIYCPNDNEGNTSTSHRFELSDPGTTSSAPTPPPATSNVDREIKRYSETGRCSVYDGPIRFRDRPAVGTGVVQGSYFNGESVNYDLVVITEGYTWISWTNVSGTRRYMPITDRKLNENWASCK